MLISISDLHMCSGEHDDFHNDQYLIEFVNNIQEVFAKKKEGGEHINLLILNGDILDILEAPGSDYETKVSGIKNAHAAVFKALNDLAREYEVLYLRGNHDWDAFRPQNIDVTQTLFPNVTVLNEKSGKNLAFGKYRRGKYTLHYLDPSGEEIVVHVEHGNQYDEFNNFFHNDPSNPETSLGSLIITEIVNVLEDLFPNIDNIAFGSLAEELKRRLKLITAAYELDGSSPNRKKPGLFSRLSRMIKKLHDDIQAEVEEQKRELKLQIANFLIDSFLSVGDAYVKQAQRIAKKTSAIVVFGHTHWEQVEPLSSKSLYANSGTWTRRIQGDQNHTALVLTNPRSYVVINFNRTLLHNREDIIRRYNGVI